MGSLSSRTSCRACGAGGVSGRKKEDCCMDVAGDRFSVSVSFASSGVCVRKDEVFGFEFDIDFGVVFRRVFMVVLVFVAVVVPMLSGDLES